jgi:hypothetical protein
MTRCRAAGYGVDARFVSTGCHDDAQYIESGSARCE